MEALILIYENEEVLDDDSIDNLFIDWNKDYRPVLPENYAKLLEEIKKRVNEGGI